MDRVKNLISLIFLRSKILNWLKFTEIASLILIQPKIIVFGYAPFTRYFFNHILQYDRLFTFCGIPLLIHYIDSSDTKIDHSYQNNILKYPTYILITIVAFFKWIKYYTVDPILDVIDLFW